MSGVYSQWGNGARRFAVELLSNIHLMVLSEVPGSREKNAKSFNLRQKLMDSAREQHKPLDDGSMFRVMVDFHNMVNPGWERSK